MDYEFAKELKNAGFPYGQHSFNTFFIEKNHTKKDALEEASTKGLGHVDWVIGVPTLEELIEVCGDIILFKLPDKNEWESEGKGVWVADTVGGYLCADTYFIDTQISGETGKTPTEAVARLWLALNKKVDK